MNQKTPKTDRRGVAGHANLRKYLESQTPEERAAVKAKAKAAREAALAKRYEERSKAAELVPYLLAEEIILAQDENARPSPKVLGKLRELIDSGVTLDRMRKEMFSQASEKGWQNLTKYLFQDHIGHAEDMGLQLLEVKKRAIRTLDSRVREYKKDIRAIKKWNKEHPSQKPKEIPWALRDRIAKAQDQKMELEMDLAKVLYQVGAVGAKKKGGGGGITLNLNIPRPPVEAKDVTPISLDSLVTRVKSEDANGD